MNARSAQYMAVGFCLGVILSGCGTSRMAVLKPMSTAEFDAGSVTSVKINEIQSTTTGYVEKEALDSLRNTLLSKLADTQAFDSISTDDGIIVIDVNVTFFNKGSQAARWIGGGSGGWGVGKIMLETTFTDSRNGTELAKISTEGTVDLGFYGGTMHTAYSKAVQPIVKYAVENFSENGNR